MPKLSKPILKHGLAIIIALAVFQLLLDASQNALMLFMPPIGLALFVIVMYFIQPVIIGVLNIMLLHRLYNCEGWQIGFWLNGFFLLIIFSTINLLIQTMTGWPFSVLIAVPEIVLLAYPFGYLGKFSNRGTKYASPTQTPTTQPT